MYALLSSTLALFLAAAPLVVVAPASPHPAFAAPAQQAQAEVKPVDINTADAAELQKVPGIGEALARRIVEFREANGRFEKVDDLLNVRGIGVTSLEKLRPYLVVKKAG